MIDTKRILGIAPTPLNPAQEQAYQHFFAVNYERYRRTVIFLALSLILLVGIFDFYVYDRESWGSLIAIRYGGGLSLSLLFCVFSLTKYFVDYQQEFMMLVCMLLPSVLAAMLLVAPDEVIKMYQPVFMMMAFLAGAMAGMVFRRALFTVIYIAVAANLLMIIRPQPLFWVLSFNFIYTSIAVMALATNYFIILATLDMFLDAEALEKSNKELEETNTTLAEQASTDHLTGLCNRRALEKAFERELRRAIRHRVEISLLMIDVDHFKKYNDHFGHQSGDECLVSIAQLMKNTFARSSDVVARYGGEEFSVLLPDTNNKGGLALTGKLHAALADKAMAAPPSAGGAECVTVSIGLITIVPTQESDPEALIQLADHALYQAKHKGRNRTYNLNDSALTSSV